VPFCEVAHGRNLTCSSIAPETRRRPQETVFAAESETKFFLEVADAQVTFVKDEEGVGRRAVE
jgi:hypothetical protein